MRLGSQQCQLTENSPVRQMYGSDTIVERHRHRYEVNNMLLKPIEAAGLRVAGRSGTISWLRLLKTRTTRGLLRVNSTRNSPQRPRWSPALCGFVKAASEYQKHQVK